MKQIQLKPFYSFEKTDCGWEKFFLIIFSSIPALKFHTKHYTAIALNAMLCAVLWLGEGLSGIAHNARCFPRFAGAFSPLQKERIHSTQAPAYCGKHLFADSCAVLNEKVICCECTERSAEIRLREFAFRKRSNRQVSKF